MFEENVKKFCESSDYDYVCLLHFNKRKKTAVCVVSINNIEKIAKFCFDEKPNSELVREQEFYKTVTDNAYTASLVEIGRNYLIIDKVNGITLLDYLSLNELTFIEQRTIISKVLYMLRSFNSHLDLLVDLKAIETNILSKLKVLLFSGPVNTQNNNIFYNVLVKALFTLLLPLLKKNIRHSLSILKISGKNFGNIYHGDMHLNNIIINDKLEITLIDFEKVENEPYMLVDFLFVIGTLAGQLDEFDVSEISMLCTSNTLPYDNYLVNLFTCASRLNPRFVKNKKISYKSILKFIKSFRRQ